MSSQNSREEMNTKTLVSIEKWTDLIGNLFVSLFHRVTLFLVLVLQRFGLLAKPST